MAIRQLENITIDGTGTLFGGRIYNLTFSKELGELPSTIRVSVINDSREYTIDESDINLFQRPYRVRIGTKIDELFYLDEINEEDSESGKVLNLEFVDESVRFLDRTYIALANRIESTRSCVIAVGQQRFRKVIGGKQIVVEDDDGLTVPDIEYTLPQLFEATKGTKNGGLYGTGVGLLDGTGLDQVEVEALENYYQDYTGTLREVLSSWANDMGYKFYWEGGKVNFVDVRDPAVFEEIKDIIEDLVADIPKSSVQNSISAKDTFVRATNSFFARDGDVFGTPQEDFLSTRTFTPLRLKNIPSALPNRDFFDVSNEILERIKVLHYGPMFLAAFIAAEKATTAEKSFADSIGGEDREFFKFRRYAESGNDLNVINNLGDAMDGFIEAPATNYHWARVEYQGRETNDPTANMSSILRRYHSASRYIGRFFFNRITWGEFNQHVFSESNIDWFRDEVFLKDTPMAEVLDGFSDVIANYDKISLRGFIIGNPSLEGNRLPPLQEGQTPSGQGGYAIKEIESPIWTPRLSDSVLITDSFFVVEGNNINPDFDENTFFIGFRKGTAFDFDQITPPTDAPISIQSRRNRTAVVYGAEGRTIFNKTSYPDNYCGANVNYVDVKEVNLSEDQIRLQGQQSTPINDNLSLENFERAHSLYHNKLSFSQPGPFFSKTFEVPYIDLPGITPSVENGLQSLDVTLGSGGVRTQYVFGTEKMRVRRADTIMAQMYDERSRRLEKFLKPTLTIKGGNKHTIHNV